MARTATRLAILCALLFTACSKKNADEAPDAGGLSNITISDEDLGFSMELPPDWSMGQVDKSKAPGLIADARRRPPHGKTYLVAPRLVVTADPTEEKDAAAVIA